MSREELKRRLKRIKSPGPNASAEELVGKLDGSKIKLYDKNDPRVYQLNDGALILADKSITEMIERPDIEMKQLYRWLDFLYWCHHQLPAPKES